jgi:hypothetical protein
MDKNGAKNRWFPTLLDLGIAENTVFYSKVFNKINFQDVFLGGIDEF